jgi:hypothetical protein
MAVDRSFVELNAKATERVRSLVKRLDEPHLLHPVGKHWTVAITLVHLAFWERRVLRVLELSTQEGKFVPVEPDLAVNDLSLPLWAAVPPEDATRLAIENAEACDRALEACPEGLLSEVLNYNKRWVFRALHRNEHLDEAEAALKA